MSNTQGLSRILGLVQMGSPTGEARATKVLDYDPDGYLIYSGTSEMGTTKDAAAWQISKYVYDGNNNLTDVQWAHGDANFDNVWDNRASLPYS